MRTTEQMLQGAMRQRYIHYFKWQSVPVIGAGLSLFVVGKITAAALTSLVCYNTPEIKSRIAICQRNQDLTALFLNAIANLMTVGILNAVLIPICAKDLEKRYSFDKKPRSDAETDSTSVETEIDLYDRSISLDTTDNFDDYAYNRTARNSSYDYS